MSTRGPQNGEQGHERGPPLGYWALRTLSLNETGAALAFIDKKSQGILAKPNYPS